MEERIWGFSMVVIGCSPKIAIDVRFISHSFEIPTLVGRSTTVLKKSTSPILRSIRCKDGPGTLTQVDVLDI